MAQPGGGNKNTLLMIYKSFILSKLDYCSFIYSNCSNTLSKKLDTIQYKSLLIATGGLKGTSLKALLSECGETPLYIRRKKLMITYLLKIKDDKRNMASTVLEDIKYYQLEIKSTSKFNSLLTEFLNQNKINLVSYKLQYELIIDTNIYETVDVSQIIKLKCEPNRDNMVDLIINDLFLDFRNLFLLMHRLRSSSRWEHPFFHQI